MRVGKCRSYFVYIKVQIEKLNRFYYPDIIVICGEEDQYIIKKPKIIIEVLSPSTSLTDRREKLFAYQEIESLDVYIMIEQDCMYAEIYRRRDDGLRSWIEFVEGEEIEFDSVGFKMPMTQIYEGVELPEPKDF